MQASIAVDTQTDATTDDFYYKYRLKSLLLSIFEIPNQALIFTTPLFYISWRLQRTRGIAQAPGFARIGRLGVGVPIPQ